MHMLKIIKEYQFVIGGLLFFLAALIVAGTLLWTKNGAYSMPTPPRGGVPALKPGEPNPADSLASFNAEVGLVLGTVQKVTANGLVISYTAKSIPLEVTLASGAELVRVGEQKDPAVFKKEMDEFRQSKMYVRSDTDQVFIAPDMYVREPISLADIEVGSPVMIIPTALPADGKVTARYVEIQPIPTGDQPPVMSL
jgi:hypothetical protein